MVIRVEERGFTLIEMMIVILIIGLLAIATSPFTGAWSDSANIHKAHGELDQATRYARAAALRNEAGATGGQPASRVIVDGSSVKVCKSLTGACADTWWQSRLPSGVAIDFPSGMPSEVVFDNKGLAQAVTITLSKGRESYDYVLM